MIYQHTNPSIKPSEVAGVYLLVDFQTGTVPEMILVNTHLNAAIALIGHAIKRTYRPDLICNGVTFPIAQTKVQTGMVLDVYVECVKRVDDLIPEDIDGVFNHEDFNNVVTEVQARHIFMNVLKDSSDITYDLLSALCSNYDVNIDTIMPPAPAKKAKITPDTISADTLYPKILKQDKRSGRTKEISLAETMYILNGFSNAQSYSIKKD